MKKKRLFGIVAPGRLQFLNIWVHLYCSTSNGVIKSSVVQQNDYQTVWEWCLEVCWWNKLMKSIVCFKLRCGFVVFCLQQLMAGIQVGEKNAPNSRLFPCKNSKCCTSLILLNTPSLCFVKKRPTTKPHLAAPACHMMKSVKNICQRITK